MRVLLGITGSVAAHKGLVLGRLLRKEGHEVKAILTPSAERFLGKGLVGPLLDGAYTDGDFWESTLHISLSEWAQVAVVAPVTANTMAKLAHGIADNLLCATLLAKGPPGFLLPAMHTGMWLSPATRRNRERLLADGWIFLGPIRGELSQGEGPGRMLEPEEAVGELAGWFDIMGKWEGKRVLITYGPTREPLDPVRVITNLSTGEMGLWVARALAFAGAEITCVACGGAPAGPGRCLRAETVEELGKVLEAEFPKHEILIMAAAVSDFTPKRVSERKLRRGKGLTLELEPTPDLVARLAKGKKPNQRVVGFALAEEESLLGTARQKLADKDLDAVVANPVWVPGSRDTKVWLVLPSGESFLGEGPKAQVALRLVRRLAEVLL